MSVLTFLAYVVLINISLAIGIAVGWIISTFMKGKANDDSSIGFIINLFCGIFGFFLGLLYCFPFLANLVGLTTMFDHLLK